MKAKFSNKIYILLTAIVILLLFVVCFNSMGATGSWLEDSEDIGFKVNVAGIDIIITQNSRTITSGGYIYLGTDLLEAEVDYLTNTYDPEQDTGEDNSVKITNNETGTGYYIRFKAIALADGVQYNINEYITTTDFYDHPDDGQDWLYSINAQKQNTVMASQTTLVLMEDVNFSQEFLNQIQGQLVTLHLIIEGSADTTFA